MTRRKCQLFLSVHIQVQTHPPVDYI